MAFALAEIRRWFDREVAMERARIALAKQGIDAEIEDRNVATDNPRRGGVFDEEIAKAARGKRCASVDWLWVLKASTRLSDDELAQIYAPAPYRRDPVKAREQVRALRRRARAWWERRTRAG